MLNEKTALSYSAMQTALSCPRLFHYRYVQQLESTRPKSAALGLGKVVHACLEAHMGGASEVDIRRAIAAMALDNDERYVQAMGIYLGYIKNWPREAESFEVIKPEYAFEMPLKNPKTGAASTAYYLAGKVDGVIRDKATGELWIIEHKTRACTLDLSTYINKLFLDRQIHMYAAAVEADFGEPVVGVVYDMITKLVRPRRGLRSAKKETEELEAWLARVIADYEGNDYKGEAIYHRERVPIDQDLVAEVAEETWALKDVALGLRSGRVYPVKNNAHCFAYNSACEFWRVCSSPVGGRDLVLETEFQPRVKDDDYNVLDMVQTWGG